MTSDQVKIRNVLLRNSSNLEVFRFDALNHFEAARLVHQCPKEWRKWKEKSRSVPKTSYKKHLKNFSKEPQNLRFFRENSSSCGLSNWKLGVAISRLKDLGLDEISFAMLSNMFDTLLPTFSNSGDERTSPGSKYHFPNVYRIVAIFGFASSL